MFCAVAVPTVVVHTIKDKYNPEKKQSSLNGFFFPKSCFAKFVVVFFFLGYISVRISPFTRQPIRRKEQSEF